MAMLSLILVVAALVVEVPSCLLALRELRESRRRADAEPMPAASSSSPPPPAAAWPPPPVAASPPPAAPGAWPPPTAPIGWPAPPAAPSPWTPPARPTLATGPMPLGRRFAAFGIDFLPLLPAAIIQAATEQPDGSSALSDAANNTTGLGSLVYGLAWGAWLLNLVWTCRTGRSFGKAVFGGRVVDLFTGAPIGAWRSIGRNVVLWYSGGLAAAASWFRPDRRGLQDVALKAVVIQDARPPQR